MLPRHARTVNSVPLDVRDYLMNYFGCRGPRPGERGWLPSVSLAELGIGQADCVLALLRAGEPEHTRCAEVLVGRSVEVCPPCLRMADAPMPGPDDRCPDERRVRVLAAANPRRGGSSARHRFDLLRDGMTVRQFMTRGGRRRDVRAALRHGWIQLEG